MSDWVGDSFAATGRPRPLGREFRERLERALRAASSEEEDGFDLTGIDRPRPMPPSVHARVHERLVRGRGPRRFFKSGLAAACVLVLVAGTFVLNSKDLGRDDSDGSLRTFASRADFLSYVRREGLRVTGPNGVMAGGYSLRGDVAFQGGALEDSTAGGMPMPMPMMGQRSSASVGGAPKAPPAGADAGSFSKTNVQEEGVDEPDLIKTDGRTLAVADHLKVWLLDVSDRSGKILGSSDLPNGVGMFLAGDRLIHFSQTFGATAGGERRPASGASDSIASSIGISPVGKPATQITVLDISDPRRPSVIKTMKVDGNYIGARMVDGVIRLIVQSGALGPEPVPLEDLKNVTPVPEVPTGTSEEAHARYQREIERAMKAAELANKAAVRKSEVEDWLPKYSVETPGTEPVTGTVHDWSSVSRPPERAGISMLTVMTIDPSDPRPTDAVSMVGAGEIIYSSATGLYVTSSRIDDVIRIQSGRAPEEPLTRIHKFDISGRGAARYVASGQVAGYLLNQFSMSEHEGHLRVASTRSLPGIEGREASGSESSVTTFKEQGDKLVEVGSVGGLGKGERIYSVRFIGPMGYVVTFRQVDPLYVVDLRDPAKPEVKGELKIPGYSAYLHPISDTLILGVGRFATNEGRVGGLQFSLFDVSDPANPRRLHERVVGQNAYSEVESNHLAFMYWAPKKLMVVPASIFDGEERGQLPFLGALAMSVDQSGGFGEPLRLSHAGRASSPENVFPIRRSVVVGQDLITISDTGVLLSDLETLRDRTFVSFPRDNTAPPHAVLPAPVEPRP